MTPDGSRIGRQPNSVKHKTMLELASIRGKETPETPATPVTPVTPRTPITPITPATPITPVTPATNVREKEVPEIPIMNEVEKEAPETKVITAHKYFHRRMSVNGGVSLSRGLSLSLAGGDLCPEESLSRGVSVWGISVSVTETPYTVEERAVRILLECILVKYMLPIQSFKVCWHVTSPSPCLSKSPSKFNIVPMVIGTVMGRIGLKPILPIKVSSLFIQCNWMALKWVRLRWIWLFNLTVRVNMPLLYCTKALIFLWNDSLPMRLHVVIAGGTTSRSWRWR